MQCTCLWVEVHNVVEKTKKLPVMNIKPSVIVRFAIIGLLWLLVCGWYVAALKKSGNPITLMSLFPLIASAFIVFIPLYKKYIRNDGKQDKR